MGSPRPPAPMTATARTPAMSTGAARGSRTSLRTCPGDIPSAVDAARAAGSALRGFRQGTLLERDQKRLSAFVDEPRVESSRSAGTRPTASAV